MKKKVSVAGWFFLFIGGLLYFIIGFPLTHIYTGWVLARDMFMDNFIDEGTNENNDEN